MVRVRLKGVNFATKTLADGTLRKYWYAWRGGPLLRGEPGTPEFVASYAPRLSRREPLPECELAHTHAPTEPAGRGAFLGVSCRIKKA